MQRSHHPELLDSLPPEHPDAQHSRRDLRLINRLMGNHRWITHTLPPLLCDGELALEIGAGTGELGLHLAAHGIAIDGLDFWPRPEEWPRARAWHADDLRTFSGYDRYTAVVGNLIFHQFTDDELTALGAILNRTTRLIVASEPARHRVSQAFFPPIATLFGANHVTQHDARVSIAAGFCGDELPQHLGLNPKVWDICCSTTTFGAYRMVAVRRA